MGIITSTPGGPTNAPRPLYRLPELLASQGQVWIVGSEEAADALRELGLQATTWPGGTGGIQHVDWSPLAGRRVICWPDQEQHVILELLHYAGAIEIKYLERDLSKPDGWDAWDAVHKDGWDKAAVLAWGKPRVRIWTAPSGALAEAAPAAKAETVTPPATGPANNAPPQRNYFPPSRTEDTAPEYSEEAIALAFAERHANRLRYVATWGQWYVWRGTKWCKDETTAVYDDVRSVVRGVARQAQQRAHNENGGRPVSLASRKTVAAVESLAKADRRIAATTEQWDADPMLLNTPDGAVNLYDGSIRPSRPGDYCTTATAVAPSPPGAAPELWLKFLSRVTGGKQEMIDFLQRVAGYSLTGLTTEHALFFLYGTGANGKSLFLNTLREIMGDYARTADMNTFMASASDRHPADLAMLRGARLVVVSETEEGNRWAEAKIKTLTGGDPIAARFMRQDYFEYRPNFKLLFAGNHKPAIRGVGEAMRRRLNLCPFTVTIPADERDPNLAEKLRAEWPAILRWAIDGCLAWQKEGLSPPAIVRAATEEYLDAEDMLGLWLDECCEREPASWASTSELHRSFTAWAKDHSEYQLSMRRFSQALEDRGFKKERSRQANGFRGIAINLPDSIPHWDRN